MLSIILIETEHAQHIGAVCRVMANFGISKLILINPQCKKNDWEALKRAKHEAASILNNAIIADMSMLKTFDYLVGTTARNGRDYNIPRSPMTPEELSNWVHENNIINDQKIRAGLIIGREGHGLSNQELLQCDLVVTIPTHPVYVTMNISHAVAVLLYEIYKKLGTEEIQKKFPKAGVKEKEVIMCVLEERLAKESFKSETKRETQRRVWKKLIGKAMLTKREAFALIGFLRKM